MKSVYSHRFLVRTREAVRVGWACLLVSALILYVKGISKIAAVPVLASVLAVLLSGPSLGTVLHTSMGVLTVVVPTLASTIAVLQILTPPISKVTGVVCIALSSYVIAYFSGTHLMGRKVALAEVSVVFVMAHYTQDINITVYPLKMMVTTILGIVCAIVATVFPFPKLAVWEVQESSKYLVRGTSETFKTLVRAISVCNSDSFGSLLLHSNVISRATADSLAEFKNKQVDVSWELGMCGARHASTEFTKSVQYCNLHLKGMELALESGYVLTSSLLLRCGLKGSLLKLVEHCKSLLSVTAGELLRLCSPSEEKKSIMQKLIEDAEGGLHILDLNYLASREMAYYSHTSIRPEFYNEDDMRESERKETALLPMRTNREFRSRVSLIFFIFNLQLYCLEAINLVSMGPRCTVSVQPTIKRGGRACPGINSNSRVKETQLPGGAAVEEIAPESNSVFLEFANCKPPFENPGAKESWSLSLDPCSTHDSSSRRFGTQKSVSHSEAKHIHQAEVDNDDGRRGEEEMNSSSKSNSGGDADPDPTPMPSPSVGSALRSSSSRDFTTSFLPSHCTHIVGAAMEKITHEKKGNSGPKGRIWKWLQELGFKVSRTQGRRSFKTALAMATSAVAGELVLHKEQSFWAPLTVGFLIGNYQGGSWRISYLRLLGTVLGAVYGFLALSASHHHRWAILLLLLPWVIFSSFVRSSPMYGYAGVVSAFTAAILMLGGYHSEVNQYAFNRITLTFVGILCFVFVETMVLPERAVVLVRQKLISSLADLRECIRIIITVYTERGLCPECRSKAVKAFKVLHQRLRDSFAHQTALSEEAALEPELWFVPFPAKIYSKLISIQGRMVDLLFFMECSLHATTGDCLIIAGQMDIFLGPLRPSLMALQDEVLGTVDSLRETLEMEKVSSWDGDVIQGLKRWVWRCAAKWKGPVEGGGIGGRDTENPQTRQVDSIHPLIMLGHRNRSADGTPLALKSAIDGLENRFQKVIDDLFTTTMGQEKKQLVRNDVVLSIGSFTFSLHALLRETVHLESAVHKLLQEENLRNMLNFWEKYSDEAFHGEGRE